MAEPVRLRLSRAKGFNLQEHSRAVNGLEAVNVSRPGPWGNCYRVWRDEWSAEGELEWCVSMNGCHFGRFPTKAEASAKAVELYRHEATEPPARRHWSQEQVPHRTDIIKALRGRNLACFCRLDDPCHADVQLEIANGPLQPPSPGAAASEAASPQGSAAQSATAEAGQS